MKAFTAEHDLELMHLSAARILRAPGRSAGGETVHCHVLLLGSATSAALSNTIRGFFKSRDIILTGVA